MAEYAIKFRPEARAYKRMKSRVYAYSQWSKDYGIYSYIKPHEAFNHTLYRKLFYLGEFAPLPTRNKWGPVYTKFMSRHAPHFVYCRYCRWGRKYTGKFF